MGLKNVALREILDLAVQLESCGECFYRKASLQLEDGPLKTVFESLSAQEVLHRDKFSHFLSEPVFDEILRDSESEVFAAFGSRVPLKQVLEQHREIGIKIKYLTENQETLVSELGGIKSVEDLLSFATFLEETSVLLYESLLGHISGPVARTWVRAVLNEEKDHLKKLLQLRSELDHARKK